MECAAGDGARGEGWRGAWCYGRGMTGKRKFSIRLRAAASACPALRVAGSSLAAVLCTVHFLCSRPKIAGKSLISLSVWQQHG